VGRSPLERDLQNHLTELSKTVHKMPGKISTIVLESVRYLQKVYSKEAEDVGDEISMTKKVVGVLKEKVVAKESGSEDLVEKMMDLEKVLSECNVLATSVTDRERRMKDRLADLLLQLDREISFTRRMVDRVSRIERETSISQLENMSRAMVMEEMQTMMSDGLVQQQVPHMTPLPSLHRLPSPPPTAAEVETVKKKGLLGGLEREREYGRSWRRIRERRVLLEE